MSDSLIGKKLGDYVIQELLGRGGMAHVYRGLDPNLQRFAAVKVIDSRLLTKGHEEEYRARFRREARAIAKLTHPNIVGVYQFGEYGPLYYMAMEFIEGDDLHHILKLGSRLTRAQILRVVRDMGAALDYAHAGGVIHRDVKPSNIMVKPDGRAVLTDFGLALDVPEGTGGNTFGSAHYIAPEQVISSGNAVPQSDLYALGVVLYQMLTGKVPFDDSSAMSVALKHLSDPPPPPRQVDPTISIPVEKVILRALEKEPGKRFRSGEAFYLALEEAMGLSEPITGSRPSRLFAPDAGSQGRRSTREIEALNPGVYSTFEADSDVSEARKTILLAQRVIGTDRRRPLLIAAALGVVALLIIGLLLVFSRQTTPSDPDPSAVAIAGLTTEPPAVVDDPTATPTSSPSESPTDPPLPTDTVSPVPPTLTPDAPLIAVTDPPSPVPTETQVSPTPTVPTETPTLVPPTSTVPTETPRPASATPIPTTVPTSTPAPTRATPTTPAPPLPTLDASADLILRYNPDFWVLYNNSRATISVNALTFERLRSNGLLTRFEAARWSVDRVAPGDCLMLWRIGIREVPPPDYCNRNLAWFAVGQLRYFWVSDIPDASFTVLRNGLAIATCPTNTAECAVSLRP
jgi:serine/threonine protein kinase